MLVMTSYDNSIEMRWEPTCKKNRLKIPKTIDPEGFIDHIFDRTGNAWNPQIVERRDGQKSSFALEYVFWAIGQDKYVRGTNESTIS